MSPADPLSLEEEHSDRRLEEYYAVLSADRALAAELDALERSLPGRLPELLGKLGRKHRANIARFVERWALPRGRGVLDVWLSLLVMRETGKPRLIAQPLVTFAQQVGTERVVREKRIEVDGQPVSLKAVVRVPEVVPPILEPFMYDPRRQTHSWARRNAKAVADEVYRHLIEQIDRLEQQAAAAGYRPPSPRYRRPGELRRGARRLYRRAVRGESYQQIGQNELDESGRPHPVKASTVRDSVLRWAKDLDVPLPSALGKD